MKERCLNPNCKSYKDYGARGIAVCDRWLKFENFLSDMGEPPEGMTLERRNNFDGYHPGNCRWATRAEQNRNKRLNVHINCFGFSLLLADVARTFELHLSTLRRRVNRGLSWQEAFDESIAQIATPAVVKFAKARLGYPGVYTAQGGKFRVYQLGQRKAKQVGVFATLEEAIAVSRSVNV